jgi:tRNA threonylcarbamoyladenosine biosynthesis protein TsaE
MEIVFRLNDIEQAAEWFLEHTSANRCFTFSGDMGAGKTTFISAVCKLLGADDNFSSPTFSIVNEYNATTKGILYHIDLYRLKDAKEAVSAGVEDCLFSGSYCFVEWPERAPDIFPENTISCFLYVIDSDTRKLKLIL